MLLFQSENKTSKYKNGKKMWNNLTWLEYINCQKKTSVAHLGKIESCQP